MRARRNDTTRARRALLAAVAGAAAVSSAIAACGGERAAGPRAPAASLAVAAGDSQRAEVGTELPVAPSVVVRDSAGRPVAGVPVLFRVVRGGGTLADSLVTSDARGVARLEGWTLGRRVGWQRVVAGASGVSEVVNVDAFADPGPPTALLVANTPPRLALPGGEIFGTVNVRVEDRFGNAVFAAPPRGAPPPRLPAVSLTPTLGDEVSTVPDPGYNALTLRWRFSATPGPRTLAVRVGGASVTIDAATYVPPYRFVAWAGDNAVKVAGDTVAEVALHLEDGHNDALAGVAVRFRVVSGGGTLRPAYGGYGSEVTDTGIVVRTGQNGTARAGPWRLGTSGAQVVRAEVPGVGTFDFVATLIRPLDPGDRQGAAPDSGSLSSASSAASSSAASRSIASRSAR